jgi:fatty acid desaturase
VVALAPLNELALGRGRVVVELLRPVVLAVAFVLLCAHGHVLLAIPVAAACCLASFVLLHDAMHAALGLPRAVNELVIAASGLLMLKSGHAVRVTHLRHHGRSLEPDDVEGAPIAWSLVRVVLAGPFHILSLRVHALRMSPRTARSQLLETALTLLVLVGMIELYRRTGNPGGLVYWLVVASMSATMALWAAYVPHHVGEHPLVRGLARYTMALTPALTSLVHHELHHEHPRVPTALLPRLAASKQR